MKLRTYIGFLIALAAICASQLGYAIDHDAALASGLLFAGIGDIEIKDINDLLEKQGKTFEEFKSANDARIKALESKGYAPADVVEKVDKINSDLTKLDKEFVELMKKANRPKMGNDSNLTEDQQEYKQAFGNYLRKGADNGLADLQRKAYNAGSGPDAGYLVIAEMDTEITRFVGVVSAIGRLARTVNIGTDTYKKIVKKSGMAARRVGAGATGGQSATPTYAELQFTAFETEVEPWVYNSTLEDSVVDLEADLANETGIAFAELAGLEFVTGSGVDGSRGITTYDTVANANYAWGKIGYAFTGVSGGFHATTPGDNIVALQHSLKSQYRPNARFVMADSTLSTVRQMKDGSGSYYLWNPDALAGFGGRLLGSPVEIDDNMPIVAANSLSIAYGDFAQGYLVVNRSGIIVIRDNITEKGKTKFNFRKRWGGGVQNFEAIKLLKFGTS